MHKIDCIHTNVLESIFHSTNPCLKLGKGYLINSGSAVEPIEIRLLTFISLWYVFSIGSITEHLNATLIKLSFFKLPIY